MSMFFFIIQFFILTWRASANYAEWLFSLRKRLCTDTFAIFCYSTDYADYAVDLAAGLHNVVHETYNVVHETYKLRGQDKPTRDYTGLRKTAPCRPEAMRALLQFHGYHNSFMQKKNIAQMAPKP